MDLQRQRVYKSEWDFEEVISPKSWKTIRGCQNYVDKLTATRWFKNRFGNQKITLKDGRTRQKNAIAYTQLKAISLPEWAKHENIVLHEVAHCVLPYTVYHNKRFCATLLELIEYKMGRQPRKILEILFRVRKVAYK